MIAGGVCVAALAPRRVDQAKGVGSEAKRLDDLYRQFEEPEHVALPSPFDRIPQRVGLELMVRWKRPCQDMFDFMACAHPSALIQLVLSGALSPADLTFAAESVGAIKTGAARLALMALTHHRSAIVREGAVLGLGHLLSAGVAHASDIESVLKSDTSEAVRASAQDVLAGF